MRRGTSFSARKIVGLGFLPEEARHGFLIDIPNGSGGSDMVCITEHRGSDLDHLGARAVAAPSPGDPSLRVVIDRTRWRVLAPAFWEEANRRLRANGLPAAKFQKNPSKPVPVHPSLGKELCILCWAVEEASPDDIPNALRNWEALAPEERWWLYTMTVATTGQACRKASAGVKHSGPPLPTIHSSKARVFHPVPAANFWGIRNSPSRSDAQTFRHACFHRDPIPHRPPLR